MIDFLFFAFSGMILGCGFLAVWLRNLLHAAIAMMGCLLSSAALFLLMHQEFVALMVVMVYVGGVIILVVYTILLTTKTGRETFRPTPGWLLGALITAITVAATLTWAIDAAALDDREPTGTATLTEVGERLLIPADDGFLLPFEIISVLLLAALIGAATVAQHYHINPDDEEEEGQS